MLNVKSEEKGKEEEEQTPSFWCWTKPASAKDAKNWDLKKGGPNWGFCSDPAEALGEEVDYQVTMLTSNIEGAGAKGVFDIQMWGNEGRTEEINLTSDGFA
jgi:hypothetical protein